MKEKILRIFVWISIAGVLTMLAIGGWMMVYGNSQTTESLKWLQLFQTICTFLIPPVLCAWMWDENRKPFRWLKLDQKADPQLFVLAVAIMVCAIPAINLLADWNSRIELPESLGFIEQKMRLMEEAAAALTERFMQADSIGGLLINIGLMALLPALSEELSFRGTLQQILGRNSSTHLAVWITAFVFSAIHMQFYGFIPRMLMGALFGYVFIWTGCLWIPIVMHFTNNGIAVLVHYICSRMDTIGDETSDYTNWADTIGAGSTWWLGAISLIITSLGLLIFYRRTHKQ